MMKLILNEPNLLKTLFDAIESIVDEVQMQVESDNLSLRALDRSHITYINLLLKKGFFDEFTCTEPVKINIDTEELLKVLKRAKSDDILTLSVDDGNLIIVLDGSAKRTFKVRLIDIEYEAPSPPDLIWDSVVEVPLQLFKNGLMDMEVVSDKVALKVDSDKFMMDADGDFGDSLFEYIHGARVDGSFKSIYSLDKIKEMMKADKFTDTVTIGIGNNMPLNLSLVNGDGILKFLLAPRIESEE
jgi:proliferating cell nuclear antigen